MPPAKKTAAKAAGSKQDHALMAWYSPRTQMPKMHLDESCTGLDRTPEDMRAQRPFSSVWELLEDAETRPCRVCSLADCLVEALKEEPRPSRGELVTFSSQPAPTAFDGNKFSFKYTAVSDSGAARLVDIASRLSLPTAVTCVGPVAFNVLTSRQAAVVAANLRTLRLGPYSGELPQRQAFEVLWTLSVDAPPELSGEVIDSMWKTARLLA